ncbi:MAG: DUF1192 domain-containing protein [Bosea sp. (in: a-proteobacteria)]
MSIFGTDDDLPRPKQEHQIGQDVTMLAVRDLDERIELLRAEITRLELARTAKNASRSAADAVFGKKG